MFRSIKTRMIVSVAVMAALVGGLVYFSSVRITALKSTLDDLESLQEFKSHVLIPQKDMNQFLAAMEATVLQLELGEAAGAQEAYDGSVDAEQDIAAEFVLLEESGSGELLDSAREAHEEWEVATDFLKAHVERVAAEHNLKLVRPETADKPSDAHVTAAMNTVKTEYAAMSAAELEAILADDEKSPVETADNLIDGLEDATDEVLAAEKAAGEKSLKQASQTILFGSLGVMLAILVIGSAAGVTVSRPLGALKQGAERIAAGDLDYQFKDVPDDEVGSVVHSVQRMAGSLKDRIRNMEEMAGLVMITGEDIRAAATSIEPKTAEVETIVAKSTTLRDLVGQILASTKS